MACSNPTRPALAITPAAVRLSPLDQQVFSTSVTNAKDTAVEYSVKEGAAGGTITAQGLYTAPVSPGTFHVLATSKQDSSVHVQAEVTVSGSAVSVAPIQVTVAPGAHAHFSASVGGAPSSDVSWSVQEGAGGGNIDASGSYTAPAVEGVYHVVATASGLANAQATAAVVVSATAPTLKLFVEPPLVTLTVNQKEQFTDSLTGTPNQVVTWSVVESGGGTVDASGLYTAPATTGTYHLLATSTDDARVTQTVAITVVNAITVLVSPSTGSVAANNVQTFVPTVTGSSAGVNWSIAEAPLGGSVTSSGVYTAPAQSGTYHLVATSIEDPRQTATVPVLVTPEAPVGDALLARYSASSVLGTGGTAPANGTPVAVWTDLSQNKIDLAQDAGTFQPTFNSSALNGKAAISFDGADDFMYTRLLNAPASQPNFEVVVYRLPTNPTSSCTLVDAPWEAGLARNRILLLSSPPGAMQLFAGSFTSPNPSAVTGGTFHTLYALFDGPLSKQWQDAKVVPFGPSGGDSGPQALGGILVGGRSDATRTDAGTNPAAGTFCKVDIAELIFYTRGLTDAEIAQTTNWLRARYGIP